MCTALITMTLWSSTSSRHLFQSIFRVRKVGIIMLITQDKSFEKQRKINILQIALLLFNLVPLHQASGLFFLSWHSLFFHWFPISNALLLVFFRLIFLPVFTIPSQCCIAYHKKIKLYSKYWRIVVVTVTILIISKQMV